jgi:hypothetical protein
LQNARIVLDDFEVILHSADSIASVGILHPLAFHVEAKPGSSSSIEDGTVAQESSSCLYEVNGGIVQTGVENKQTGNPTPTSDAYQNMDVCISKTGKTLFSIGCWTGEPSSASKGAYSRATYFHLIELFIIPTGRKILCPCYLPLSNVHLQLHYVNRPEGRSSRSFEQNSESTQ